MLLLGSKRKNNTVFQLRTLCLITFPLLLLFVHQSVVTLDGGKLVHVQKWDDKETTLVRDVSDNNLTLVSIVYLQKVPLLAGNRMFCCPFGNYFCQYLWVFE